MDEPSELPSLSTLNAGSESPRPVKRARVQGPPPVLEDGTYRRVIEMLTEVALTHADTQCR